jgi:N6-adenosine-specific RNA methylase IME4
VKLKIQRSFAKRLEKYETVEMRQPFATAIIDPDWPYTVAPGTKDFAGDKRKGKLSGFTRNRDGKNQYRQKKPLSLDELKMLPVGDAVGGYILLWTVGPFLINGAAADLLKAWGFEPASIITWAKYDLKNKHGYGGVGYWFLGNAEFCIVAKRPGYPSIRTGLSSLIVEPKGFHSSKPDNIHAICEARFPGPYLEIFGRELRSGWTVLGNEAPGDGKEISDSLRRAAVGTFAVDSGAMDQRDRNRMDGKTDRFARTKRRRRAAAYRSRSDDVDGDELCPRLF